MTGDEMLATFQELTSKVEELQEIKDVKQVITDLQSRQLDTWGGDELSLKAGKLSILLVNLGIRKVNFRSVYEYAKQQIDADETAEQLRLIEEGTPVGRASAMAENKFSELKKNLVIYKHRADIFEEFYRSCSSIVTVIQSRLRTLGSEHNTGMGLD